VQAFQWFEGRLRAEEVRLDAVANSAGTPVYVYSASAIRAAYRRLKAAFSPLQAELHYAVKANSNLHLLRLLRGLGAGMDVVSGGELERAWLAGTPMNEIAFAGVGKTEAEIRAALDGRFSPMRSEIGGPGWPDPTRRGPVGMFNVESESELERIAALSRSLGTRACFCLRVNPNVDPHTHEYTTTGKEENKFGIDFDRVPEVAERFAHEPALEFRGLHVHLGSPVPQVEPYLEALAVLLTLCERLERRGSPVKVLNLGGGWPVSYTEEASVPIEQFASRLVPVLRERVARGLRVRIEPGRSLLANAGVLLTRVQHVKRGRSRTFVVCDAGMHTLIRPALYRAFHFVWPVAWDGPTPRWREDSRQDGEGFEGLAPGDVVGPICETGDFLARGRYLPPLEQGDLVAVFSAGAYGMSMASNYNDHGRPAEVLVDGGEATLINERQSLAALLATEQIARPLELMQDDET
jgi:diaminopimelate decarboxylase